MEDNMEFDNIQNESSAQAGAVSMLQLLNIIFKRRKFIISAVTLVVFAMLIKLLFLTPNVYTATSTILPSGESRTGRLNQILQSVGQADLLRGGSNVDLNTYLIFDEILRSRRLVDEILLEKVYSPVLEKKILLIDYFKIEGETKRAISEAGYNYFIREIASVDQDVDKGITSVRATTVEPEVSATIANMMVQKLDEYNRVTNSKKAAINREFIEERMEEKLVELTILEEALQEFLEKNKRIEHSPELQIKKIRLEREVSHMGSIYLTLRREYEISKIEEMKNMPIIKILDIAIPPALKSGPKRAKTLIISLILTIIVAVFIVLGEEYFINIKDEKEFKEVSLGMKEDLLSDVGKIKEFFGKIKTSKSTET